MIHRQLKLEFPKLKEKYIFTLLRFLYYWTWLILTFNFIFFISKRNPYETDGRKLLFIRVVLYIHVFSNTFADFQVTPYIHVLCGVAWKRGVIDSLSFSDIC